MEELSRYLIASKYTRFNKEQKRRETYEEAVDRVLGMHESRIDDPALLKTIEEYVKNKIVMPSMRSLQFGGDAVLQHNMRLYNCVGTYIRNDFIPEDLAKVFYCLLCGSGVGFRLPNPTQKTPIAKYKKGIKAPKIVLEDSILGWCDAAYWTISNLLYHGVDTPLDYSNIRPKGSPIKTGGGVAPGPEPLEKSIENIKKLIIDSKYLDSLNIYDCIMYIAEAVLSGGVRRSATIALFHPEDVAMATAKTGDWYKHARQRAYSNNSIHAIRETIGHSQFVQCFQSTREFGEPGIVFTAGKDYLTNPCAEITFNPVYSGIHGRLHGLQTCNLTTINAARIGSKREFYDACKIATALGTIQATYTDFTRASRGYVESHDEQIIRRDALLGVSICGILDNPKIFLDPQTLEKGARYTLTDNERYAEQFGINKAARICTVKPEGTASLVLGAASGVHPRYAREYWRRVEYTNGEKLAKHLIAANPLLDDGPSVWKENTSVLKFPLVAPKTAIVRDDLTALEFFDIVKMVKNSWCQIGSRTKESHNVSNTIPVRPNEWEDLERVIWDNKEILSGISLLPMDDKVYNQAPQEEVTEETRVEFEKTLDSLTPVDYTKVRERKDTTENRYELACMGGTCDI